MEYGSQTEAFLDVGGVEHDTHAVTHSLGGQVLLELCAARSGVAMGTTIIPINMRLLYDFYI